MRPLEPRVLLVGALTEDSAWLSAICAPLTWKLESCADVDSTLAQIASGDVAVVLCDADYDPNLWRGLLAECHYLANSPGLIVTSRLADERLWAEALNLGAYDVLAKPFDEREVSHAVSRALAHWLMPASMPLKAALRKKAGAAAA